MATPEEARAVLEELARPGDEAYLLRTELAPYIEERQTTYHQTFLRLLEL